MRVIATVRPIRLSSFLALAGSVLMVAPYAGAKPNPTPAPMAQSSVTGHLYLEGMAVKQIVIDRQGDKTYLYLQHTSNNVFAIVDVTDPAKPVFLERITLPEAADSIVNLPDADSDLAMAFAPETGSAAVSSSSDPSALPKQSVRLLDLTDPEHPTILTTFNGVTSTATDDGHKLVFLVNSQGLWVVSYQRTQPLPRCTSSDALTPLPECQ
jgi:hypothetical protein